MSRTKGGRFINAAMTEAGIIGKHATPTGLRHSFAISCLELWPRIPFKQIQKWMDHKNIDLTLSHFNAFTNEIENMEMLWDHF